MSKPKGTIPVKIARHRAEKLRAWLADFDLPQRERSALGCAGIPIEELDRRDQAERDALEELKRALTQKATGRRRNPVATYFLPVAGLMALNRHDVAVRLPRTLRPFIWQVHPKLRLKPGFSYSDEELASAIAKEGFSAETIATYKWRLKKGRGLKPRKSGMDAFSPENSKTKKATLVPPSAWIALRLLGK